jgi:hypothetical protein
MRLVCQFVNVRPTTHLRPGHEKIPSSAPKQLTMSPVLAFVSTNMSERQVELANGWFAGPREKVLPLRAKQHLDIYI